MAYKIGAVLAIIGLIALYALEAFVGLVVKAFMELDDD